MRKGVQDGGTAPEFRLPSGRIPTPLLPGVRGWRTREGWLVLRLHYSADPEKNTDEWKQMAVTGYRGGLEGRDWRREMEVDFSAYKGEPVYPGFDADSSVRLTEFNPHLPLWRGWDFGYRHPAVVWLQQWTDSTLAYLHELYPTLNSEECPGIDTGTMADLVIAETEARFPGARVLDFCDPAGNQHKDTSDFSSVEILQQKGINPEWSVVGRKNRINYLRPYIENGSAFRINPHCVLGIKALSAAYRYPEERSAGQDQEMPDLGKKVQREPYIHIIDAMEYVAACNLQIEWVPLPESRGHKKKDIGTLAEMYLGVSKDAGDRRDMGDAVPLENYLEDFLSDHVGEDLTDAFRLD